MKSAKFMLPALADCHCHILPIGQDMAKLHLGSCHTRAEILDAVRDWHVQHPDGWLLAVHYDQNRWGGQHLTRHELDSISTARPMILRHVNGHASVVNTPALIAAGLSLAASDPADGSFGRDADGMLDGTTFEGAHETLYRAVPPPTADEAEEAILAASRSMAAYGIASASDMQTTVRELAYYQAAADAGSPVKFELYLRWKEVFGPRANSETAGAILDRTSPGVRVAGVKIFADGAIGSATAAIYGAYSGAPAPGPRITARRPTASGTQLSIAKHGEREVSGQLIYTPEKLKEMVLTAHEAGFQIATHAIGDYAVDLVMDAYEATGDPSRHRIEHAMLLSDPQIERLAKLDTTVVMQPEFLLRFGHAYLAQLGPDRAARLNRTASLIAAGVPLALSSDRPIVEGNPWVGMKAAVHRPDWADQAENITPAQALAGYLDGARKANRTLLSRAPATQSGFNAIGLEEDPELFLSSESGSVPVFESLNIDGF